MATSEETLTFTSDGPLLEGETWSGAVAGSVTRTYDNNFRVTGQQVNGSDEVSFQYDADGLLTGAGALTVDRDPPTGLVTGSTLDLVTDTAGYNEFGELTGSSARFHGAPLYEVQFGRDLLGRITEQTETIDGATVTYTYTYDLAGRLTDVWRTDPPPAVPFAHYDYDANGNRLGGFTASQGTIAPPPSYDAQDRLLAYTTSLAARRRTPTRPTAISRVRPTPAAPPPTRMTRSAPCARWGSRPGPRSTTSSTAASGASASG